MLKQVLAYELHPSHLARPLLRRHRLGFIQICGEEEPYQSPRSLAAKLSKPPHATCFLPGAAPLFQAVMSPLLARPMTASVGPSAMWANFP